MNKLNGAEWNAYIDSCCDGVSAWYWRYAHIISISFSKYGNDHAKPVYITAGIKYHIIYSGELGSRRVAITQIWHGNVFLPCTTPGDPELIEDLTRKTWVEEIWDKMNIFTVNVIGSRQCRFHSFFYTKSMIKNCTFKVLKIFYKNEGQLRGRIRIFIELVSTIKLNENRKF